MMKIGYSQADITPSLDRPVYLAGFGPNRRAVDVHDPLYARALSLSDGQTTLALCALDLMGFLSPDIREIADRVREKHPAAQVVIASTHTHHAPDAVGLWGPDMKTSGVDREYIADIQKKILAAILGSLERTEEAHLKYGAVVVPGLAKNARNPELRDEELCAVQFVDPQGRPLVSLFDFPCHPEVLWEFNPHITSDYPGVLRREVERATGAPCLFFAGALGGMMTPDVKDHSFEECETMGRRLAEEGLRVLQAAAVDRSPALARRRQAIRVKLTNPLYRIAFRRGLLPDMRDKDGFLSGEVSLIRIGGLWLASVPGELFPKLGLQAKAAMREAGAQVAAVIGLANEEWGYIMPAEDFRYPLNPFKPGKHYEETNSIGKTVGPRVMEGLRALIAGGEL